VEIYSASEVFTPTQHAKLNFVERPELENRLYDSLRTPGKQIVVYGHSGSGKSSLLERKLRQIYAHHITTRCVQSMTFEQLVLDAFDQLDFYYINQKDASSTESRESQIDLQFAQVRLAIQKSSEFASGTTSARLLPPQLTPQRLAQFMGRRGLCWVLEDFHKLLPLQKKALAQAMKVFVDESGEYPEVRVIAIGAVGTAREVVEYDVEMRTRVAEVHVPAMSPEELHQILRMGEKLLNITFTSLQKDQIVKYSNGLASVCHDLALNVCQVADIERTSPTRHVFSAEEMASAVRRYVSNVSDSLKAQFDSALRREKTRKYDNTRLILSSLAKCDENGMSHAEILDGIRQVHPEYPPSNLTNYLDELQRTSRGGLIRYDANSNKYMFSDPIYQVYAKVSLLNSQQAVVPSADAVKEGLLRLVEQFLKQKLPRSS
jgi:hypothetical protein